MRIVVHAGLHKSGTTTVQSRWKAAYDGVGPSAGVRYPRRGNDGPPGHHYLTRSLQVAFTEQRDPDLVLASTKHALRGGHVPSLANVVRRAAEDDVETLVISTEDLDRSRPEDAARIAEAWQGHEVHLLLTVTSPVHRWCSGWQELVKHGLADYPCDAVPQVLRFAALGRLPEIVETLSPARTVVRLVRTSPVESLLPEDLATLMGLPAPRPVAGVAGVAANASLGRDAEIVLRLNRAGLGVGTDREGREHLRRIRAAGVTYVEVDAADRYAVPTELADLAAAEASWLAGMGAVDPHVLLADWIDLEPPEWYAALASYSAVLDLPDEPVVVGEAAWRERQRRAAESKRAGIESRP